MVWKMKDNAKEERQKHLIWLKQSVSDLSGYLARTRGIGHTQTALAVAKANRAMFLCANVQHARQLGISNRDYVTVDSMKYLLGQRRPLIIDNFFLIKLLGDCETIRSLENTLKQEELEKLRSMIDEQTDKIDRLEDGIEDLVKKAHDRGYENAKKDFINIIEDARIRLKRKFSGY